MKRRIQKIRLYSLVSQSSRQVKGDEHQIHRHLAEYLMAAKKGEHQIHRRLVDLMGEIIPMVLFMIAIMTTRPSQEIIKEGNGRIDLDIVRLVYSINKRFSIPSALHHS